MKISNDLKMITSAQLRAARALLRWSAEDLARESKIGVATIRRAEAADGIPTITTANMASLARALESAGIQFISENGDAVGVQLLLRS